MTQHSDSQSGFLHNFKRLFEPAPPAPAAPAPGADEWPSPVREVKHLEVALQQLRQRAAALRPAPSVSQRSTKRSPVEEQQALEAVHNQAAAAIEVVPTMAWETVAPEVHKGLQRFNV